MLLGEYLRAFALTLAVEVPLYTALLAAAGVPVRRALACGAGVNVATHPVLWFGLYFLGGGTAALVAAEIAVTAVEWLLLIAWTGRRDRGLIAAIAVLANTASLLAGLLIR
jgi:hypothetical protein